MPQFLLKIKTRLRQEHLAIVKLELLSPIMLYIIIPLFFFNIFKLRARGLTSFINSFRSRKTSKQGDSSGFFLLKLMCPLFAFFSKAPCKRTQHYWKTTPIVVGCYRLRPFAHPVACYCVLLGVVGQSLKPVKLKATCKRTKQLPTMWRGTGLKVWTIWLCGKTRNNTQQQQGLQMDATGNIQQCWKLLVNNVASVCRLLYIVCDGRQLIFHTSPDIENHLFCLRCQRM